MTKPHRINYKFLVFILFFALSGICLMLCTDHEERANPELFKEWGLFFAFLHDCGQTLLITAILSAVAELAVRKEMLADFTERTSELLGDFFNKTFKSSVHYGFQGIADELNFVELINDAQEGDEILWLDTYAPGHQKWLDIVAQKAHEGVRFKFLILKPGCAMACLRAKEIGKRFESAFDPELRVFAKDIMDKCSINFSNGGSMEVKFYDDLLAVPFYLLCRGDEPLFGITSFYLHEATGVKFPHLEWYRTGAGFIAELKKYYDWKWDKASAYDLTRNGPLIPPAETKLGSQL